MFSFRKLLCQQSAKFLRRKYSAGLKSRLVEKGPSHLYYPGPNPLILDKNIGDILDNAVENWPDRECLVSVHQNLRLTYSDAQKRANKLAAGLTKLGLKSGDRLCVWSPNCVEWYLTFLACSKLGLILVAANPSYQQAEIEYCLQLVQPKAVLAADTFKVQNYTKMLLTAKEKVAGLEHIIIFSNDHHSGTRRYVDVESLANPKEVEAVKDLQQMVQPNSACNIQFTSGSTGKPKATTLSQMQIINNSKQPVARFEFDKQPTKICLNVPFFHAFGLIMAQMAVLHSGATMVLEGQQFNPVKSLETVVKEKCDVMYGTPTMWVNLVDAQRKLKLPLNNLRLGVTGGSPATPQLFKNIRKDLKFDEIMTIYGLTECTAIAFQNFVGDSRDLVENTVGFMSDYFELKIVDDKGLPVPFNTPGELWIKGYSVMMGYWNNKEKTSSTMSGDWLKTGDQFVLRKDGYGIIVGRLKDMIIRGGENIFPKEVEDFLESHPDVLEAHVFGAHDYVYGEEISACVKVRNNSKITPEGLKAYGKGKIAHFKIPRYVFLVDDFPKTASGKIQKLKLRQLMEDQGKIPRKPENAI